MRDTLYYRHRALECRRASKSAPPSVARRLNETADQWMQLARDVAEQPHDVSLMLNSFDLIDPDRRGRPYRA